MTVSIVTGVTLHYGGRRGRCGVSDYCRRRRRRLRRRRRSVDDDHDDDGTMENPS